MTSFWLNLGEKNLRFGEVTLAKLKITKVPAILTTLFLEVICEFHIWLKLKLIQNKICFLKRFIRVNVKIRDNGGYCAAFLSEKFSL